jgi:hypothetical protein
MNLQHTQNMNWSILNWNVRGLNDEAKQRAVRAKTEESACTVFCIQETKMTPFDSSILKKIQEVCIFPLCWGLWRDSNELE